MQIIAIVNLVKREKVRFNNKWIWVAIILLFNILGPIIYFAFRGDNDGISSQD
ncbi:MAG: PLD nuclease N-terminal domain-containing protein [Bacillus subtilis]|nr:PLD nuclease N-terminal domain-containing protein [Bacillus subtilis]